ncbi:MAG: DUF1858 domain-containing protein [Nanoarchaeota archaeon]|nr:DUF1858 domain-containing protein [Nanoarchaeota archaeon]
MKITKNTNISKAMEEKPELAEALFEAGVGCMGCIMAHAETLKQGLKTHGFSDKKIEKIINKTNKK